MGKEDFIVTDKESQTCYFTFPRLKFCSLSLLPSLFLSVYLIRPPRPARNSCHPREQRARARSSEQEVGLLPRVENLYLVA